MNLSKNAKFTKLADHTTAGTDNVVSTILDMQGFDGVVFLTSFGTANAGNYIYVDTGTDASLTDAANLAGSKVTSGSSDEDVVLDIYKPLERYLRVTAVRGSSSTLESIWAVQYGPRKAPVSNSTSGTIIAETHISPAEGTM